MTEPSWRTTREPYPALFIERRLELARSALVIVDMQRYWIDPDGPMAQLLRDAYPEMYDYFYQRLATVVLPELSRMMRQYRTYGLPILHVTTGATLPGGRDLLSHLQRRAGSGDRQAASFGQLTIGSQWHEEAAELKPEPGELVLNKTSRSAFSSTGIDSALRNMGVGHVLVGGTATDGCVLLTALDATDHGYETYLIEEGTATFTPDVQETTLRSFARLWGGVLTSEQVSSLRPGDER